MSTVHDDTVTSTHYSQVLHMAQNNVFRDRIDVVKNITHTIGAPTRRCSGWEVLIQKCIIGVLPC